MSILRWEDPPPANRRAAPSKDRREHWARCAAVLRQHRGQWAVLMEGQRFGDAGGITGMIRAGRLAAFRPPESFEATTRTAGDLYIVYARYIGESS